MLLHALKVLINNNRIIHLRKNQPAPDLLLNCGSVAVLEEELPGKKKNVALSGHLQQFC